MSEEKDKPYLAAIVDYLDRGPQTIKRAIHYPITRIELFSAMSQENPEGKPTRVFIAGEDGFWHETQ
jgi:hypothetical protein